MDRNPPPGPSPSLSPSPQPPPQMLCSRSLSLTSFFLESAKCLWSLIHSFIVVYKNHKWLSKTPFVCICPNQSVYKPSTLFSIGNNSFPYLLIHSFSLPIHLTNTQLTPMTGRLCLWSDNQKYTYSTPKRISYTMELTFKCVRQRKGDR